MVNVTQVTCMASWTPGTRKTPPTGRIPAPHGTRPHRSTPPPGPVGAVSDPPPAGRHLWINAPPVALQTICGGRTRAHSG